MEHQQAPLPKQVLRSIPLPTRVPQVEFDALIANLNRHVSTQSVSIDRNVRPISNLSNWSYLVTMPRPVQPLEMGMQKEIEEALIRAAIEARELAYAPYSEFRVGAALLTVTGRVYSGCNVENSSYGLCICAERTAICKAVSEGDQQFIAVAVAATPLASPCGACRQFLFEFGDGIEVISVDADAPSSIKRWTSGSLLPDGFRL